MKNLNYYFFIVIFSILYISTASAAGVFPRGCEVIGFGYENGHLILNETGNQTLYLIQNHSNDQIMLEHFALEEVFLSPKLRNKISPNSWSAFASEISNQHFKCIKVTGEQQSEIDCSGVLEICQYPRVKFALSNMGTYWVSMNKSQPQVLKDAIAKGILLHW